MKKKLQALLKNERGLTLIELLAVVVILGIIAAIAIPSIGGLIDNTRKDAHLANAQQMISSAKTAVSSDNELIPADGSSKYLSLGYLETEGYLDKMKDPDGTTDTYVRGVADPTKIDTAPTAGSYVQVKMTGKTVEYSVVLLGSKKEIGSTKPVAEADLKRSAVTVKVTK